MTVPLNTPMKFKVYVYMTVSCVENKISRRDVITFSTSWSLTLEKTN